MNAGDWNGWRWPVPTWAGRRPVISHEFEAGERYKRGPNNELVLNYATHLGLDLMFAWDRAIDPKGPRDTVALARGGARGFIAPKGAPIVAAGPGKIWQAGISKLGLHVQIDHGAVGSAGGINTYYQHLDSFARPWIRGDVVEAGAVLGTMGGDPANDPHLRHLHFELWLVRKGIPSMDWPTDPAPYLAHWQVI